MISYFILPLYYPYNSLIYSHFLLPPLYSHCLFSSLFIPNPVILALSSLIHAPTLPKPHQSSKLVDFHDTRHSDFILGTRISYSAHVFRTRHTDFILGTRISYSALGFHTRDSDFILGTRISYSGLGFHTRHSNREKYGIWNLYIHIYM